MDDEVVCRKSPKAKLLSKGAYIASGNDHRAINLILLNAQGFRLECKNSHKGQLLSHTKSHRELSSDHERVMQALAKCEVHYAEARHTQLHAPSCQACLETGPEDAYSSTQPYNGLKELTHEANSSALWPRLYDYKESSFTAYQQGQLFRSCKAYVVYPMRNVYGCASKHWKYCVAASRLLQGQLKLSLLEGHSVADIPPASAMLWHFAQWTS